MYPKITLEEFLNYKIKKGIIDSESQFYIYNEIRLKIALEFVDLVFYNNLDLGTTITMIDMKSSNNKEFYYYKVESDNIKEMII